MSKWHYRVTEDAEQDLLRIEEYVSTYADADFVDKLDDMFLAAFDALCDNPFVHPEYQLSPPMRTLRAYRSVNVYRYKVFYWVDGNAVEIYRILHLVSDFTRRYF